MMARIQRNFYSRCFSIIGMALMRIDLIDSNKKVEMLLSTLC